MNLTVICSTLLSPSTGTEWVQGGVVSKYPIEGGVEWKINTSSCLLQGEQVSKFLVSGGKFEFSPGAV